MAFNVTAGLHKRRTAIGETRTGAFAKLFDKVCWNLHGLRL